MSGSGLPGWVMLAGIALLGFLLLQAIHFSAVLGWEDLQTRGLGYYGLPAEKRARFQRILRWHARLLSPILVLLGRLSTLDFARVSFRYGDLVAPRGTCSPRSFARAVDYRPGPEDVFVVTQMKSGTTWMQHLVYEILFRGAGSLVETGTALYAVSPWLEARTSVPVDKAPLIGDERPRRLIKTHLTAELCPSGSHARYIYVVRHPVACFASCMDFVTAAAGPFAPNLDTVEEWFCSANMWWGPWPAHVAGWWRRAGDGSPTLFVRFEEMQRDLPAVAQRVAAHLGVEPLAPRELERVVHKCGFEYMRRHAEAFEMHPPHLLAPRPRPLVSGAEHRHRDVPEGVRRRILAWCAAELDGTGLPLERLYPLAAGAARS